MTSEDKIAQAYHELKDEISSFNCSLVAVSKRQPLDKIQSLYDLGHRMFGENRVQEFLDKVDELPSDIAWHLIGHLQTNKVKYIIGRVALIHSLDRLKLARVINQTSQKAGIITSVLLQIKIADEESKFGYEFDQLQKELSDGQYDELNHLKIVGVMGMATFTDDKEKVKKEFNYLKTCFEELKKLTFTSAMFSEISMGMSGDYMMALEEGATMIRVGSKLFGPRTY